MQSKCKAGFQKHGKTVDKLCQRYGNLITLFWYVLILMILDDCIVCIVCIQRISKIPRISEVLRCRASQGSSGDWKSGPGTALALLQRVLQTLTFVERSECFWVLSSCLFFDDIKISRLHMMLMITYLPFFAVNADRGVACPTSNVKAARSTTCVLSLLCWPFSLLYSRSCKAAKKEPMHDDSSTVTVQQLFQSSHPNS